MLLTNSMRPNIKRIILLAVIQLSLSNGDFVLAQESAYPPGQFGDARESFISQAGSGLSFGEYLTSEPDSDAPTIELRRKFLGSQKFVFDGKKPQGVYGFWGFSFRSEFEDVLSIHPAALREAKRAYPYRIAGSVGLLALVAISAKGLIDTINETNDVSRGRIPESRGFASSGDFLMIAVAGGVSIISGILGKKHLANGIRIFNEKQKAAK